MNDDDVPETDTDIPSLIARARAALTAGRRPLRPVNPTAAPTAATNPYRRNLERARKEQRK